MLGKSWEPVCDDSSGISWPTSGSLVLFWFTCPARRHSTSLEKTRRPSAMDYTCPRQDGFALAYATQELQGDEDIVEAVLFYFSMGGSLQSFIQI